MSAIVCGKRSFFEESAAASTTPVSKKIRFSSSSPVRFSPPHKSHSSHLLIHHLASIFPDMDKQLLEQALEECGDDLDLAIRSLHELRLGSESNNTGPTTNQSNVPQEDNVPVHPQATSSEAVQSLVDPSVPDALNLDGAEWVELFVREMTSASDVNDAKARAARALEIFEKSIQARAAAEARQTHPQENMMLRQQNEALVQENTVLKRAVVTLQKRQKEFEDQNQELQHLKQSITQYQEQLRTLEVSNYALTLHLKQAQQNNSIPGRFHPDIF